MDSGEVAAVKKILVFLITLLFLVGCTGCPSGQTKHYILTCADGTFEGHGGCPLSLCSCYEYCQ